MLSYFYTKEKDRLYVYDSENGFFKGYNKYTGKWQTTALSFSCVEHDNDDFTVISEEAAKEMSNGASFEEDYNEYLSLFNSVRNSEN